SANHSSSPGRMNAILSPLVRTFKLRLSHYSHAPRLLHPRQRKCRSGKVGIVRLRIQLNLISSDHAIVLDRGSVEHNIKRYLVAIHLPIADVERRSLRYGDASCQLGAVLFKGEGELKAFAVRACNLSRPRARHIRGERERRAQQDEYC